MQMSIFLALVQTLIGAATLGVALLALESGDPPYSDRVIQQQRGLGTLATGTSSGVPALRGQVL